MIQNEHVRFSAEVLKSCYPRKRFYIKSQNCKYVKERAISGILVQGACEYVKKNNFHKTVRHKNINILISTSVSYNFKLYNQDFEQSYIYKNDLDKDICEVPDPTFGLTSDIVLMILKPLCALAESYHFCFIVIHLHWIKQ